MPQDSTVPPPWARWLNYFWVLAKGLIVLFILGGLVHAFMATPFRISGVSMAPSFHDGQFVLVEKLSYLTATPERGDVVVLQFPAAPTEKLFIKRIVGLPTETIEIRAGQVFVNGNRLVESYLPATTMTEPDDARVLGTDEYYLIGDNRPNSNDSRFWGPARREHLVGRTRFSLSPTLFGWVSQPVF